MPTKFPELDAAYRDDLEMLKRARSKVRDIKGPQFDPAELPEFYGPSGKYYDPEYSKYDRILFAQGGREDVGEGPWRFLTVGQGNVPAENWYSATHHQGVQLPDWAASMTPEMAAQYGLVIDPHGYDPRSWFLDPLGRWNYAGDVSAGGGRNALEFRWPGGSPGLEGRRGRITTLADWQRQHGGAGGVNPARERLGWGARMYRDLSDPIGPVGMGTNYWETPSREFYAAPQPDYSGASLGWFRPDIFGGEGPAGQSSVGNVTSNAGNVGSSNSGFGEGVYTGTLGGPGDPGNRQFGGSYGGNPFTNFLFGPSGGSGTGAPTQRMVGMGASVLGNLLFPGAGLLTGPLARMLTRQFQQGNIRFPQFNFPSGAGGGQAGSSGGGYYSPQYLRSIGYEPGQGTDSLWAGAGPSVGGWDVGAYGVGGGGGSFFHDLPGVRGGPLAGSFAGLGGGGIDVSSALGKISWHEALPQYGGLTLAQVARQNPAMLPGLVNMTHLDVGYGPQQGNPGGKVLPQTVQKGSSDIGLKLYQQKMKPSRA